jgi:hypothetical protein
VPLNCASGSISSAKLSKTTRCLSFTREGEGAGAMMLGPLISDNSQTAVPFQFPFIILDGQVTFFNFNPCRLQLQPLSPINFQNPSLFYFVPFSLMDSVCLMQSLPDDLVTQIIIHSINDELATHFLNLRN